MVAVIGYLLVVPFAAGQARFRVPPEPLMAAAAGLGVAGWVGLVQTGLKRLRRTSTPEPTEELGA
jgi:hypothetical protein